MLDAFDTLAKKPYIRIVRFDRRDAQDMSMATDHGSTRTDISLDPNQDIDWIAYLYARPCQLLEAFCDLVRQSPSRYWPSSKAARGGGYDPRAHRSQMSPDRKDKKDSYVLADGLAEVLLITKLIMPAEDEFSQGMRQVLLGDAIQLWVVFAHQIYLEIYRTLHGQVDRGFGLEELRVARNQVPSLKDYSRTKSQCPTMISHNPAPKLHRKDEGFHTSDMTLPVDSTSILYLSKAPNGGGNCNALGQSKASEFHLEERRGPAGRGGDEEDIPQGQAARLAR